MPMFRKFSNFIFDKMIGFDAIELSMKLGTSIISLNLWPDKKCCTDWNKGEPNFTKSDMIFFVEKKKVEEHFYAVIWLSNFLHCQMSFFPSITANSKMTTVTAITVSPDISNLESNTLFTSHQIVRIDHHHQCLDFAADAINGSGSTHSFWCFRLL